MVNYLVSTYQNYFIVNIDMLDYCSTRNTRLEHGYTNYKFIQGNISEHCLVQFILEEYKIDTIIHLAANTHVDNSFGNSLEVTRNNIVGTHTLLECCRIYGQIIKFITKILRFFTHGRRQFISKCFRLRCKLINNQK